MHDHDRVAGGGWNRVRSRLARIRGAGLRALVWTRRELGDALLCMGCVAFGVFLSTALPFAALFAVYPSDVTTVGVVLSPLAVVALAVRVFDVRTWPRWRAAHRAPLGVRMLRACSDGVLWLRWWRASA